MSLWNIQREPREVLPGVWSVGIRSVMADQIRNSVARTVRIATTIIELAQAEVSKEK